MDGSTLKAKADAPYAENLVVRLINNGQVSSVPLSISIYLSGHSNFTYTKVENSPDKTIFGNGTLFFQNSSCLSPTFALITTDGVTPYSGNNVAVNSLTGRLTAKLSIEYNLVLTMRVTCAGQVIDHNFTV